MTHTKIDITSGDGVVDAHFFQPQEAGPHLLAPKMLGEIYVGVPEIDPHLAPGETDLLENALNEAGANYTVEIYPGAQHGFAVPGHPVYDRDSSERHWDRLLALFNRNLKVA